MQFQAFTSFGGEKVGAGQGEVQPYLRADTLFSAICNTWARVEKFLSTTVNTIVKAFENGHPPFKISSAFPFSSDNKYYLPKPRIMPIDFVGEKAKENRLFRNFLKAIDFIPLEIFLKWTSGVEVIESLTGLGQELFSDGIRDRNQLDRLTLGSQLFQRGAFIMNEAKGLFFILEVLQTETPILIEELYKILALLGVDGVGGDRTSGYGQLKLDALDQPRVSIEELTEDFEVLFRGPVNRDRIGHCLLSLYYPKRGELSRVKPVAYELVDRRGSIFSSKIPYQVKRLSLRMFAEGSIFTGEPPVGAVEDVTPTDFPYHRIKRYGLAMSAPIKVPERYTGELDHADPGNF